jgi:hypothetical protein
MKPYRERWIEDETKEERVFLEKECTYERLTNILGRMNKLMPYMEKMALEVAKNGDSIWCEISCETDPTIGGKRDDKEYGIEFFTNEKDNDCPKTYTRIDQNGHLFMRYQDPNDDLCIYIDSDGIYTVSQDDAWDKKDREKLSHYVKTYYQLNVDPHDIHYMNIRLFRWDACQRDYTIDIRKNDDEKTWRIWVEVTRKYKTGEVNVYDEEELDDSVPTEEELKAIEDIKLEEYKPLGGR